MVGWRLELFFKSAIDLRLQTPFIRKCAPHIQGVNLTNKSKDDNLLESVAILQEEIPGLDICVHYSVKYNYHRSPQHTFTTLTTFLETIESRGGCSVLVVTGSGKRKGMDSVTALERLATSGPAAARAIPICIAFNPYLPTSEELNTEFKRVRTKLMSEPGRVATVYLQMGTDFENLEAGLDHLVAVQHEVEKACAAAAKEAPDWRIYGSVFVPSKKLLAQMRFRPWNGVFLSEETYLSSVEAAEATTGKLLDVYRKRGVVPLVESAVKTEEQLETVLQMMMAK